MNNEENEMTTVTIEITDYDESGNEVIELVKFDTPKGRKSAQVLEDYRNLYYVNTPIRVVSR